MPTYEVDVGGHTYEVDAPDPDTAWQWANMTAQAPAPEPKKSTFMGELQKGFTQPLSSMRTTAETLFGSPEEAAIAGVKRGQEIAEKTGEGPSLEAVKKAYKDKGLLSAAGEAVSQIPRALAGQGGTFATAIGGARLGSMAGAPLGPVGSVVGGGLGAAVALYPQFFGSDAERQAAEQQERGEPVKIDTKKAALAAAGQSAAEGAGQAFMFGKRAVKGILGIADDAALKSAAAEEKLVSLAKQSVAGAATRGAIRGAGEIPVEMSQQVLERWQAGLPLTDAEALKEYGEAAYLAGLVGAPIGGTSQVMSRNAARSELAQRAPAQPPAPSAEAAPPATTPTVTPPPATTPEPEEPAEPTLRQTAPEPEAEVPTKGREDVTNPLTWLAGPQREETTQTTKTEEEVPTVGREEVTNPLMWTAGPKNAGDFAAPRPFTNQDIIDTGVKLDSSASWFANNVVGRTADEVQALVDAKPWLIKGNRPQARILRSLLAPSVPAFEEAPNVPRAETPAPEPSVEPRRSEPGLGVPSGTTDTGVVGTGDGVRTAPAPTEPVGLGLVPPKQPARKGRAAKVAQPDTLTGAPAQPATPFDDKELDRKGKEETLSLSTPEMLAKLNAAKNQPGETYTATVDIPAYFDEPARQDSRDYTVVRGEGDWTVISYKNDEGDQQVLVPPSRARALTDEQLVQERNAAEFPFNKTVSVTKRQPTTQRAKPAQSAAPVPTAAPEVVDEEEAARRQEAADMAARMEAVRKQEVEDRKRAQGEANIASEELRKARAEADKAKAEAEKAKAEAEKAKVEAKAAERAAARDEARRAAEEDLAFDTGARATKLATRKDFSLNPDDTKTIDRLIQEKKYGEANKVMDDIEKQVADKTYVSAPAKADISNILDRFAESRGYAEEAYNDGEVALIRTVRKANGERVYRAYNALTDSLTGLSFNASYRNTNGMFTDEQIVRLKDALAADEQRDRDMYAQFPEGPFTQGISNIIGNVVGGASVDTRYVKLLRDLTKAMGMGNVRIFLYHGKDIAGQPEKYNLNGPYFSAMARARPKESQKGGTRPFGPANKDFLLFINDNMSEETTIEVLTHELGHIIEHVAFQNAPFNVQQEILNEYKAWQAKVKTGSVADMVHSLRNRNLAAETLKTATPAAMVADMTPEQIKYWTGFAEWFADNVSRWATTADKPLTITEKFFARIAQMMRDLVAIVTGRKYPPNKKVAAFLESMGPGSSNAWFGVITPPTAGQGIAPLQTAPDNPKFNKWFGKSKVVNAAGSPLVLYHGTSNDIEDGVFRPSKYGSLGEGVYFTSDPEAASKFAMGVRGSNKTPKAQGNVVPAYLRIEMPFDDEFFVGNTDWQNWAATVLRRGSQYEYEMRSWGGPSEFEEAKKLLAKLNSGTATLRDILFVHGDAEAPWGREILKQVKAHGAFDGVILKDSPKGFDEYVVFNPNQVKSAIGNRGTYSLTSPKIEDALAFNKTTPNGQAVLASLGITNPQQAYGTKAMYYGMANSSDVSAIDKVRTKVADSAASIDKRIMNYFNGAVRNSLGELNPMGLYRQAQDYSKMLLSFFKAGSIEKDASTGLWEVKDKGTTPPAKVLELVQQYADTSRMTLEEGMAAAGRALEAFRMQNLLQQDPQFPNHLTQGELNAGLALYNSDPIFAAMNAAMDASRKELVDHLVAVGRLSPDEGDDWKNVIGYVPFDRIEDFAKNYQKTKRTGSRAPLSVTKLPKLIGSQIRPVGNVFENYLNTMGWMVGQVMNTDARNQTLKFLESIKKAKFLGADTDGRPNIAYGYQDGGLVYWELPSEYDALAFKAETQTTGNWLRYLSEASNILRTSVTALPPFALKQVVDDIQRALLTSGVQNPLSLIGMVLTNFPKIALAEIRGVRHRIVEEAEALGLSGEYDFKAGRPGATFMEDMGYRPRGMFRTILHRLDGITRASDLAVRRAIYDQTMKESNDKLLAQTRAREFINFRRRGSSDFVGVMVKTIPFFNAYVQGMDVLYRSASGIDSGASINRAAARKMFWSRAGIAIALSTVYAMGKDDDDEEYNEADLRTRDGNWFVGGTKLSVPGELGALFKVIPERVVEYYKRKGTPEEQEAMEAVRTALSYMFEQYVGRVTPVPQAVKPLLEAWTNYSFLTGRELIGIHQKNLDPSMQVREGTSELAIAIANFARDMVGVDKISPIIVDNVLRGYLGSTAAMTVMVTDGLLNPTRIDRPLHKYALLSNYMIDPVGKRRIAEFYDERDNVGRANATLNEMVARGDLAGAEAYMQKHEQVLMLNTSINATLEQLEQTRAYRKYLNSPESAATMSMEERMEMRTEVEKMERELVGWLREAKTMIRKDAG